MHKERRCTAESIMIDMIDVDESHYGASMIFTRRLSPTANCSKGQMLNYCIVDIGLRQS